MKSGILMMVLVGLLVGCGSEKDLIVNEETILVSEIKAGSYSGEYAMYTTERNPWLCVLNTTEVVGGALTNLHAGLKVSFDATSSDNFIDNSGSDHMVWFVDKITIIGEVGENQPAPMPSLGTFVNPTAEELSTGRIPLGGDNYKPLGPR